MASATATARGRTTDGGPTPLPWATILSLLLCLFTNSLALTVNFPFAPLMVASFHVTDDPAKLGVVADRIGRRPVLLVGLTSSAALTLLFGSSRALPQAVAARFLQGCLSTVFIAVKTSMSELCDQSNQARGFTLMGFCWGFGLLVGPVIGGFLALPAQKYPALFPPGSFFDRQPFLLPCAVVSALIVCGVVFAVAFVPETLGWAASRSQTVNSKPAPAPAGSPTPEPELEPGSGPGSGSGSNSGPSSDAGSGPNSNAPVPQGTDDSRRFLLAEEEGAGVGAGAEAAARVPAPGVEPAEAREGAAAAAAAAAEAAGGGGGGAGAARGKGQRAGSGSDLGEARDRSSLEEPLLLRAAEDGEGEGRRKRTGGADVADERGALTETGSDDPGYFQVVFCQRETVLTTMLCATCGYMFIGFDELFPLWSLTPWEIGGLGFGTNNLGLAQLAAGVGRILLSLWINPRLINRLGPKRACQLSLASGVLQALIPWIRLVGRNGTRLQVAAMLVYLIRSYNECAMESLFVLTSNSVRHPQYMGAVNGVVQMVQNFFRALAPWSVASLFAWSASRRGSFPLDYHLAWLLLGALHVLALFVSTLLPDSINRRKFIVSR